MGVANSINTKQNSLKVTLKQGTARQGSRLGRAAQKNKDDSCKRSWITRLRLTQLGRMACEKKTSSACVLDRQAQRWPATLCKWRLRPMMVSTEERVTADDNFDEGGAAGFK